MRSSFFLAQFSKSFDFSTGSYMKIDRFRENSACFFPLLLSWLRVVRDIVRASACSIPFYPNYRSVDLMPTFLVLYISVVVLASSCRDRPKRNRLGKRSRKGSTNRSNQAVERSGDAPEGRDNAAAEDGTMAGALLNREFPEGQEADEKGVGEGGSPDANCALGPCVICNEDEMQASFCKSTGRKQEVGAMCTFMRSCVEVCDEVTPK